MYINLRIIAVADRDPSCNLFTLTEDHRFSIAAMPSSKQIQSLCKQHKDKFLEAWPHNRQTSPTLVPLDVEVTTVDN